MLTCRHNLVCIVSLLSWAAMPVAWCYSIFSLQAVQKSCPDTGVLRCGRPVIPHTSPAHTAYQYPRDLVPKDRCCFLRSAMLVLCRAVECDIGVVLLFLWQWVTLSTIDLKEHINQTCPYGIEDVYGCGRGFGWTLKPVKLVEILYCP
jgi:hypothetical protein